MSFVERVADVVFRVPVTAAFVVPVLTGFYFVNFEQLWFWPEPDYPFATGLFGVVGVISWLRS